MIHGFTPERMTELYHEHGLPATMDPKMKSAWAKYINGGGGFLHLLPTNGAKCDVICGGSRNACGYPLLIDGSCFNEADHGPIEYDGEEDDSEEDDSWEEPEAIIERLEARIEQLTEQRDQARMERNSLNEALSDWSSTTPTQYKDED